MAHEEDLDYNPFFKALQVSGIELLSKGLHRAMKLVCSAFRAASSLLEDLPLLVQGFTPLYAAAVFCV